MIRLEEMTDKEFQEYADYGVRSFAQSSPRFRNIPAEEAIKLVREEFNTQILPKGRQTPGHFLWSIYSDDTRVGYLHLGQSTRSVPGEIFAWDFLIFEKYRRQGLARQTMQEAGKRLKALGYKRVGLNVFGDNRAAISLYESMGFRTTQVQMVREID